MPPLHRVWGVGGGGERLGALEGGTRMVPLDSGGGRGGGAPKRGAGGRTPEPRGPSRVAGTLAQPGEPGAAGGGT